MYLLPEKALFLQYHHRLQDGVISHPHVYIAAFKYVNHHYNKIYKFLTKFI